MSTQLPLQTKTASQSSFTPVQVSILQRKCACGQHTVAGSECEECRQKREGMMQRSAVSAAPVNSVPPIVHDVLSSSGQPLDAGTRAFMELRFGHDFSQVPVHTDARAEGRMTSEAKRLESFPEEDTGTSPGSRLKRGTTVGGLIGAGIGGVLGGLIGGPIGAGLGAAAGGLIGSAASGSLSLSNDSYSDIPTESHKKIRFNAVVPLGHKATEYALVNWVKGYMKDGSGKYFKVKSYGVVVDSNFPSWRVDSADPDPVYWSSPARRWNYSTTPNGFYATDDPGPALKSERGAVYARNYRIGLYKLSDLPLTTSGTISASPIEEKPWQYSVVVDPKTGAFTHPSI